MNTLIRTTLLPFVLFAIYTGPICATPIQVTGDSLKGSTGQLNINQVSGFEYNVTWSLDTTGFDDAAATPGHEYLT